MFLNTCGVGIASIDDVVEIIKNADACNFNMVLFQVRGNANAFYPSDYEAWDALGERRATLVKLIKSEVFQEKVSATEMP